MLIVQLVKQTSTIHYADHSSKRVYNQEWYHQFQRAAGEAKTMHCMATVKMLPSCTLEVIHCLNYHQNITNIAPLQ